MASEEYERATAALDTALPDPNVANSVADILLDKLAPRLPASGTIATATDVTNAISAKDKAFFGAAGQPALCDYFQNVAQIADPKATNWAVTEDAGAAVSVYYGGAGGLVLSSGATATNDGVARTVGLWHWEGTKLGVTTINFRTKIRVIDLTGEWGIGLLKYDESCTANLFDGNVHAAAIHCDNDVVNATSSSSSANQQTDLSAYFSNNTYAKVLIVFTPGIDVKFYINDTLRATHTTAIPSETLQCALASKNTNGINTNLAVQFVEVWIE